MHAPSHLKFSPLVLPLHLDLVVRVELGSRRVEHSVVQVKLVLARSESFVVVELLPGA